MRYLTLHLIRYDNIDNFDIFDSKLSNFVLTSLFSANFIIFLYLELNGLFPLRYTNLYIYVIPKTSSSFAGFLVFFLRFFMEIQHKTKYVCMYIW